MISENETKKTTEANRKQMRTKQEKRRGEGTNEGKTIQETTPGED